MQKAIGEYAALFAFVLGKRLPIWYFFILDHIWCQMNVSNDSREASESVNDFSRILAMGLFKPLYYSWVSTVIRPIRYNPLKYDLNLEIPTR